MPLYEYRCQRSHRLFDRMVKLENYQAPQNCACGSPGSRVISRVRIAVENVEYQCPITGKPIFSKAQHEENLRRHDCRVLETGETEAAARRRAADEAEFDRKIEATVEREIEAMPSAKKERLANELLGGMDIEVTRSTPDAH